MNVNVQMLFSDFCRFIVFTVKTFRYEQTSSSYRSHGGLLNGPAGHRPRGSDAKDTKLLQIDPKCLQLPQRGILQRNTEQPQRD